MILSVSRRTDIPAFYAEWFINRLHDGYVLVRNPMNYYQVSKVSLDPRVVDCIVFWTKNFGPLLPNIQAIRKRYPFYVQYTLNAYGRDIEPALPALSDKLETFKSLSDQIGSRAVIWRYDPILLTEKYTVEWHIDHFTHITQALQSKTNVCVFSFIDIYDKVKSNIDGYKVRACTSDETDTLAGAFSRIASQYGIELRTCAESINLDKYGIQHGHCIDGNLIAQITGWNMKAKKDPNQRAECGCLESVDIGQYNTCKHGCRYCYANFNPQSVITLSNQHDKHSAFLIGESDKLDKITDRKMKSLKQSAYGIQQLSLL